MTGIHSLSAEQYFAAEGVSRSMLETLITASPLHFHAEHIAQTSRKEQTYAMQLGTLTHRCILEPETMENAFHVWPAGLDKRTKEGKAWMAEHADGSCISADAAAAIRGMHTAVWRHPIARKLIAGAKTEQCLFAEDGHGTLRKARLDLIPAGGNTLADLKTCASADEHEMTKAVERRGYYRQAAFYLDLCKLLGLPFENFALICVESAPPHDVVVYPIAAEAIAVGRHEIEGAIQTYRNCLESNTWPGRNPGLAQPISLPPWRQRELNAA